jgi:hypothetical protein
MIHGMVIRTLDGRRTGSRSSPGFNFRHADWPSKWNLDIRITSQIGPASEFGWQMSHPLFWNYCGFSECTVIQKQTAVADT